MLGLKEEYKPKNAASAASAPARSAENETPLNRIIDDADRTVSVEEASYWADQLLKSLNDLHSQNPPAVHKAIRPQNIFISDSDSVSLKTGSANESVSLDDSANLSYLPLEQIWEGLDSASQSVIVSQYDEESAGILESPLDARSDLYSLGASIYHAITKKIPADALTRSIDLLEGKEDPLTASQQLNSEVSKELSAFLQKAMEIRREDRFASAGAMQKALQAAVKIKKPAKAAESTAPAAETIAPKPAVKEKAAAAAAVTPTATISEPVAETSAKESYSSTDSFVEEPVTGGGFPKIALVAAGVLVLFSAIFGIWSLSSGSGEESKPPVVVEKTKPETTQPVTPTVSDSANTMPSTAAPATETTSAQTAKTDTSKQKESDTKKAASNKDTAAKDKDKQQPKTAPTQKKSVTVDDLLDVDN